MEAQVKRGGFGNSLRSVCAIAALAILQTMAAPAFPAGWRIDPGRTTIGFSIDATGFPRTEGRFRRFEGNISIDFVHPDRSKVAFHVQSQSVDVGSASFSDYLRSAAFLDSAAHPSIDFVSTSVEKINDHAVRVTGDLSLLGVTKPIAVEVAVEREEAGGRPRLAFRAETKIDRLAFGMNSGYPLVSREVDLTIASAAEAI
jgi:polyisoprenoid-binding protein YceI